MWAWIFDQWDETTEKAAGWSGVFGLPRELWLRADHRLGMRPIEELKRLRYNEHTQGPLTVEAGSERALDDFKGNVFDLELVLEPTGATRCGVKVCCAADGSEETVVGYDSINKTVFIDTRRSSSKGMGLKVVEAGPFHLENSYCDCGGRRRPAGPADRSTAGSALGGRLWPGR